MKPGGGIEMSRQIYLCCSICQGVKIKPNICADCLEAKNFILKPDLISRDDVVELLREKAKYPCSEDANDILIQLEDQIKQLPAGGE